MQGQILRAYACEPLSLDVIEPCLRHYFLSKIMLRGRENLLFRDISYEATRESQVCK